jgi:copper chaperone NosL
MAPLSSPKIRDAAGATWSMRGRGLFAAAATAWLLAFACTGEASDKPRCAQCGMQLPRQSRWRAGLVSGSGEAMMFDAPKCMFRWMNGGSGRKSRDAWVTEYYSQKRAAASSVYFVVGSDVIGPMGHDLVPVAGRERAEAFSREHHGRSVLRAAEVTSSVLARLDAM